MTDFVILALTALLALGLLGWAIWAIWHIARGRPTRPRALTHTLGILAGTVELGVVLPPGLMWTVDPFPIWLVYAVLAVAATAVLAWRWLALRPGRWVRPGPVISASVLAVVVTLAGIAVT